MEPGIDTCEEEDALLLLQLCKAQRHLRAYASPSSAYQSRDTAADAGEEGAGSSGASSETQQQHETSSAAPASSGRPHRTRAATRKAKQLLRSEPSTSGNDEADMRQNDSMDAFQQQISPEAKASRIAAVKRRSTGKPARPMAVNANSDGSALPSALLELATLASQSDEDLTASEQQPLAPSAGSAFTTVPVAMKGETPVSLPPFPAFGPDGTFPVLWAMPGAPLLPFFPMVSHKARTSNSDSSDADEAPALDGSSAAGMLPVPFLAAAGAPARFDALKKAAARQAALVRYLEKKKNRSSKNFTKKVLYESRKRLADARPRVRGQFVKAVEKSAAAE